MEVEENGNPRLGVDDKRHLFLVLMSKVERLFYLNKFPVDQYDFALSLLEPDVEAAWRLLVEKVEPQTLSPRQTVYFPGINDTRFMLSHYPDHDDWIRFMDVEYSVRKSDNRFKQQVDEWARRQELLEDQMLRTIKVIKALVHSCNTVGQYSRVSPELLGFLPSTYGDALRQYTKKSPYPAIDVSEKEIDTALSTLAMASLQPEHIDEEVFTGRTRQQWNRPSYHLSEFPRSQQYLGDDSRQLRI